MSLPPVSPWFALELVNGIVMLLLAGTVLVLAPREPANRALALLLVVRGMLNVTLSFAESGPEGATYWYRVMAYFLVAVGYAGLWFVYQYRVRYAGATVRRWVGPTLLALVVAVEVMLLVAGFEGFYMATPPLGPVLLALTAPFYLIYAVLGAWFIGDAVRLRHDPHAPSFLVTGVAFMLLPAFSAARMPAELAVALVLHGADGWETAFDQPPFLLALMGALVIGTVPIVWSIVRLRGHPRARGALLAAIATGTVPAWFLVIEPARVVLVSRLFDQVWTSAFPLLLAYALLRHQLLGLDVKVRWGLSKTTIAGIFVAVFFVVSETAQTFFGDRFNNHYMGIVSAGALVFAVSPLSRLADRFAGHAIPEGMPAPSLVGGSRQEDAYRRAVRLAVRDRSLTRDEDVHLFHVAEALGVPAGRAIEIRNEILDEAGVTDAPKRRRGTR